MIYKCCCFEVKKRYFSLWVYLVALYVFTVTPNWIKKEIIMEKMKTTRPEPRVVLTLEDKNGKTKEEFELTADEAFAIQTLLHSMMGTAPKVKASWLEACKAAEM